MIEISHGKPRPRALRHDRQPKTPAAVAAAPFRDPKTGHFGAGNPGGRLRQLAAIGKAEAASLLRLPVESVAPWLRGHLRDAQEHAQRLVDALPLVTDELVALCGDEAKARLMSAAALTEGAREGCTVELAFQWRKEAREWMREARQIVLTRKAVARETPPQESDPQAQADAARATFRRRSAKGGT